jgi:hypothetical protein
VAPLLVGPKAGAYLTLSLMGAYRDDPTAANALCSAANEVTPAQFVFAIGTVSVQVANMDPASPSFKTISGCHGAIFASGASLSS